MIEVNEKLTLQVAHLARIELSPQETSAFTQQLSKVLHYIETIQEVDVSGVEPLIHPIDLKTPFRPDQVKEPKVDAEGTPKILLSAPDVLDNGLKVPPIL